MISTFLHFIRKKINPLHLQSSQSQLQSQLQKYNSSIEKEEKEYDETKEETIQSDISGTIDDPVENPGTEERIYACIDNNDLPQRVQHNICNLIGLDKEELAYIKEMDCKNMFEVVKLLNKAVVSLVDGI